MKKGLFFAVCIAVPVLAIGIDATQHKQAVDAANAPPMPSGWVKAIGVNLLYPTPALGTDGTRWVGHYGAGDYLHLRGVMMEAGKPVAEMDTPSGIPVYTSNEAGYFVWVGVEKPSGDTPAPRYNVPDRTGRGWAKLQ